jgi:3-oxoacyl-[acyl-carrier protein] reductase
MEGGTLCSFACPQSSDNADEFASVVAYLAIPEASYITGASLLADGGFAA